MKATSVLQGTERASGQAESIRWKESSGEQCGCTVACSMVVMFLWCVQELSGLKEQDLPSDPPTAAGSSSTLSESHMYTSCDSIVIVCSGSVSQTPPSTHSDLPVPSVELSNIPDDGTLGEYEHINTIEAFHNFVSL